MGIGRLVFQHEDAYVADIVVILEINDQEVRRFRFVAVSQELIEFTGRLGCQVVEGHRPVGQSLQLHLKGTGRIKTPVFWAASPMMRFSRLLTYS